MSKCSFEVAQGSYYMGGVAAITGLMAAVLTLSGLFHSALRRLGQPSVISHLLAGVVVGPTVLGRIVDLRQLGMEDAGRVMSDSIYYARIVFMFFIGLEMDMRYLRRYLRGSLVLAFGGSTPCLLFAVAAGPYFYGLLHQGGGPFEGDKIQASTNLFILVLTSTASPVLTRIVTELKLTSSEVGHLAMGAAFVNDIANLAAISLIVVNPKNYSKGYNPNSPVARLASLPIVKALVFLWMAFNVWISACLVVWMTKLLNNIKQGRQYISKYELLAILMIIVGLSQRVQIFGYSASMTGFLLGLSMPRDGPTARTLVDRLTYPVHQLIMPICFGVIGARLDFAKIGGYTIGHVVVIVAVTVLLSSVGRVAGTVMAGRLIGIPPWETLVLGLLLNVKGYSDILAINLADKMGIWDDAAQGVLLLSSIINTFMAGPASAAIVRQQRRAFLYHSHRLQDLKVDQELRVLVCAHGVGNVHAMLTLSELSKGAMPVAVYLLHLIELETARKYAITHLYHENDSGTEDSRWGHAREINQVVAMINTFTNKTFIHVRQMMAISNLVSMDTDICNSVEDVRASLVIIPFHKEQRYDGRMVCRRDGRQQLNQRILQKAPCTVGIFVERSISSITERHTIQGDERSMEVEDDRAHQVVAVFLGGPDDREAVAYATRLAANPTVSVMVSRFLLAQESMDDGNEVLSTMSSKSLMSSKSGNDLITIVVGEVDEEAAEDEEFMADFYTRFVAPGHVAYTERYVSDGAEMVDSLGSMVGMYSLFIVGKGSGGNGAATKMTNGMGGLDVECSELGHIGELLASDDLVGCSSSVLVLQQHKMCQKIIETSS